MANRLPLEFPPWEQLDQAARQRRRNPMRLLMEYMSECLKIWEDQNLDEEIRRDAKHSGYREEDAVKLVRQHRKEKRP
jgi:hypothetical protein